jgi:4-hydroxybenzoate polyprenyltransferase
MRSHRTLGRVETARTRAQHDATVYRQLVLVLLAPFVVLAIVLNNNWIFAVGLVVMTIVIIKYHYALQRHRDHRPPLPNQRFREIE